MAMESEDMTVKELRMELEAFLRLHGAEFLEPRVPAPTRGTPWPFLKILSNASLFTTQRT